MENRNKELQSIFKGIVNKDENEFNKLYQNYKSLIYAVVFSMLKNKEDSEEVVQTVFEKIWNIKEKNLPTNNETAWLYNVTKNEAINYLRKQKSTLNIDDLYYIDEENEELNNIINADYYNKILSKLNTKDKEIVSLKILSSLSFKEISQILNTPIGTVQWKYYKSLHLLKMLMSNLTIFIVTCTLYIKQRSSIKKIVEKSGEDIRESDGEEQLENSNKIEEQLSNEMEIAPSHSQEAMQKNWIQEDKNATQRGEIDTNKTIESTQKVQDILNETIEEPQKIEHTYNETIENITVENKKQQNSTLFYISIIFFIMTIVFLTIWIKQKLHKSTKYLLK